MANDTPRTARKHGEKSFAYGRVLARSIRDVSQKQTQGEARPVYFGYHIVNSLVSCKAEFRPGITAEDGEEGLLPRLDAISHVARLPCCNGLRSLIANAHNTLRSCPS